MTQLRVALAGDSIVQGFGLYDIENGGLGCHAELVFDRLSNIVGVGPLIGPGFRGIWRDAAINANSGPEWSSTGSWTKSVSTDAWDKGLGGNAYDSSGGSGSTRLWTKPSQWRSLNGGICVEYIDTGGNWQYRWNGGTWTNHGQTIQNNNAYKRFYLSGTGITTIEFRAYDGASAARITLTGVEPFYIVPQGANGFIGDNLGISGIDLHDVALATSGDRLARFDSVVLGTGSPPSTRPSIVVFGPYSNDVPDINNTTTWATDLTTIRNRVAGFATVGFINAYEQGSGRSTLVQYNYRAQTKTTAATFSPVVPVFDLYDEWAAKLALAPYPTNNCKVASAMTGVQTGSFVGSQSLEVFGDFSPYPQGFFPAGQFAIIGANGTDTKITYNGTDATHFLNCRLVSGADIALVFGDVIASGQFLALRDAPALLDVGSVHPSQAGYLDLATRIYWWLRTQILTLGDLRSNYTVAGSRAAVAYAGTRAAVAYKAGLPISV